MTDKEDKNPLSVAQELDKTLKSLENIKDRDEFVDKVKQDFVAMRLKTSSKVEEARLILIEKIMEKMEKEKDLPVMALLKILETISSGGEADLKSLLSKGNSINMQMGNNIAPSPTQVIDITPEKGQSMKQIGQTLDAMKAISTSVDPEKLQNLKEVLDVEFEEIEDKKEDGSDTK